MVNTQEYQIKKKEEEISSELLKKGSLVTSYEVTKFVNEFFEHNTPGLPYYKPLQIDYNSKSNKNEYNKAFKNIETDLVNAYEIYNNQASQIILSQNTYDLEMENINKEIDMLVFKSNILEEYASKNIAYFSEIITFQNLSYVNTKNLSKNNVVMTTSEIDYNTSTLRNEMHSSPNAKIDISKAAIKLSSNGFSISTTKDIANILNDLQSDMVGISLKGVTTSKLGELTIDINLQDTVRASRVELTGNILYNTEIRFYISNDGENYFEKDILQGNPHNIWRFNREEIKAVKFTIIKKSSDYDVTSDLKSFNYILKNISIYDDIYSKTSVFTSKPIEFEYTVSDITIDPVHSKPPGTDIAYFVGVQDVKNDVEWKAIKPNAKLDLKILNKEEMILNYMTSDKFGEFDFNRERKEYNFSIHELPPNTNYNSIELRAGHSQWLLERLDVTDKYKNGIPTDSKVNIKDYSKDRVSEISPLDSTIMEIKCEVPNNYFVMSQYVICDEATIVENKKITFDVDKEIFDYAILINGKQIYDKDGLYTFKLKKGENLIQIMILLCNLDISNPDNIKTIKHDFNLLHCSKSIFAGPKMQKISYNSLTKNIDKHSLRYYAIKKVNDADRIITKFDPNYVLKPTDPVVAKTSYGDYTPEDIKMNNSEYFRMYLKFKNMSDEMLLNLGGETSGGVITESKEFVDSIILKDKTQFPMTVPVDKEGYKGEIPKFGEPVVEFGEYVPDETKEVTKSLTNNKNTFDNTISYSQDGFKGTLSKDGVAVVISGNNDPVKKVFTKTLSSSNKDSFPVTVTVNDDGFTGSIPKLGEPIVESGTYIPADTKTATKTVNYDSESSIPATISYNEDGYTGTLTRTEILKDIVGYEQKEKKDNVVINNFRVIHYYKIYKTKDTTYKYDSSFDDSMQINRSAYLDISSEVTEPPGYFLNIRRGLSNNTIFETLDNSKYAYNHFFEPNSDKLSAFNYYTGLGYVPVASEYDIENGLVGETLLFSTSSSNFTNAKDKELCWYGEGLTRMTLELTTYEDDLDKPIYGNFRGVYSGSVTKPSSDTRIWQQTYSGELQKAGVDTRVWQQNYKGQVVKLGYDTREWKQTYKGTLSKLVKAPSTVKGLKIRLMAKLSTTDLSVSPVINAIKVVAE